MMNVDKIRELNIRGGFHFFDRQWMEHFGTIVETGAYDNLCFVTSEQDTSGAILSDSSRFRVWDGKRKYTVRKIDPVTGKISNVSTFGQYDTLEDAVVAAKKYRRGGKSDEAEE